jgi:hypothetical protein
VLAKVAVEVLVGVKVVVADGIGVKVLDGVKVVVADGIGVKVDISERKVVGWYGSVGRY